MKDTENKQIHPLFDGHPEKSFSEMTPKEKLHSLYLQRIFYLKAKKAKIIKRDEK